MHSYFKYKISTSRPPLPKAHSKFLYLFLLLQFLPSILEFWMGYSYLLNTEVSLANFRQAFNILEDVNVAYCHESEIALHRRSGSNTTFFPLMTILEGGVRFPMDPLLLNTLRFYGLCPDQLPPNFFRVASCVSRLN